MPKKELLTVGRARALRSIQRERAVRRLWRRLCDALRRR